MHDLTNPIDLSNIVRIGFMYTMYIKHILRIQVTPNICNLMLLLRNKVLFRIIVIYNYTVYNYFVKFSRDVKR